MKYVIITNNSFVADRYANVIYVKGTVEELLIKIRDLVHEGYNLITHPLAASAKMFFSPYRSVVLGEKGEAVNAEHVELIESSIVKFMRLIEQRGVDLRNGDDYKQVDSWLLDCALEECLH